MSNQSTDPEMGLIEAYYTVASSLQQSANEQLRIAEMLNRHADRMCEERVRQMPQGCTRSHPHEEMNAECERLTEIARSGVNGSPNP